MPWGKIALTLAGLLLVWLVSLAALWRARPGEAVLRDGLRLLPDILGLLARLVRDPTLPRGIRVRLWLLVGYLALPIDLVPDFLPVVGHADDVIVVVLVLRSVVRRAGPEALDRHWRGTAEGLAAVRRVVRA